MKKIYLVIAGAFLILLVIVSILLSLGKKTTTNNQQNSPFPTSIPNQGTGQQASQGLSGSLNSSNQSNPTADISTIEPVETLDFKAAYVPTLNKIVVEKKTLQAEKMFNQWANQNQLNNVINNPNQIIFTNEKIIPTPSDSIHKLENKVKDFFQLMDDLNNIGKGTGNSPTPITNSPTSAVNTPTSVTNNPAQNNNQSKVYYAQCGDQSSLLLPDGCNLCDAGCGPTTVSMIASSYLGAGYDPKAIVDLYKSKSYLLGCSGSRYSNAYELLKSLGLKTTDMMFFNLEKSDTVIPQLKKYLDDGWTFFTGAYFCTGGCGHYFWITDVDAQGNIWAYDPAYGRYQIPYNENSRYPYPLYSVAFGVKK